jgi:membrane-associated phospholipid phosphatase
MAKNDGNDLESSTKQEQGPVSSPLSRRRFLGGVGGAAVVAGSGVLGLDPLLRKAGAVVHADNGDDHEHGHDHEHDGDRDRINQAYKIRVDAAKAERDGPHDDEQDNGDEDRYHSRIGSYSKGMPHNSSGEVDAAAYASLLNALDSGSPADFEAIILGGGRPQTNPQSGLAFDLEGADGHAFSAPPAPKLGSAETAGEAVELYWMALLRDTNFTDYATDPNAAAACSDLNAVSVFKGPRQGGLVTPQTLFRDILPGCTTGPYLSQFMLLPTPFGSEYVNRQQRTFLPNTDKMTNFNDWLTVQDGGTTAETNVFDPTRRFVRNGRDVAAWVHMDVLFQAYFNALLILGTPPNSVDPFSGGIGAPLNPGNPYLHSHTQAGFGTFGPPGLAGALTEVAVRGLKATWNQKWFVHRRLRPEAFGGLVHVQKTSNRYPGVLHNDILSSPVLGRIFTKFGTYLHPQCFPEGSPTHPSYTAGHATVAGACVTILKALFDESFVIPHPVVPSSDGLSLVPFSGPALTVGGELNKVASNIGTGRNIAGVHWRSDALESFRLGERIAISILRDQRAVYNENREGFFQGYTFTKFDGTQITV